MELKKESRLVFLLGLGFFTLIAVLAYVFANERMLAFDPAFHLFKIIHYQNFNVELGRIGATPSQIFPLIGLYLGRSINDVLILYSTGIVFFQFFLFSIIVLGFKNNKYGIAYLLALALCFKETFYYASSELNQSFGYILLLLCVIERLKPTSKTNYIVFGTLVFAILLLAAYTHPLSLLIAVALGVLVLSQYDWLNKKFFLFVGISFLVVLLKYFLVKLNGYESNKMDGLLGAFDTQQFTGLPGNLKYYLKFFFNSYSFLAIALIAAIFLTVSKRYLALFIYLGTYAMVLLLITLTQLKGDSQVAYDQYLAVFGLIAAVGFVLSKDLSKVKYLLFPIALLLVVNVYWIYKSSVVQEYRLGYINRLTEYCTQNNIDKAAISKRIFPEEYARMSWALPFETLLNSSLHSPLVGSTVFLYDTLTVVDSLNSVKADLFLGPEWSITWFNASSLEKITKLSANSKYYNLSTQQDPRFNSDSLLPNKSIVLNAKVGGVLRKYNNTVIQEVSLFNQSQQTFSSIPTPYAATYLSYHIYDTKGNLLIWDGKRTCLEHDVLPNSLAKFGLVVNVPYGLKEFIIEVDLLTENVKWWGLNKRIAVKAL